MSDLTHIVHPLEPLYSPESRILILGSFPSVKTREAGFFYGHPQNRFWPLLSRLLAIDPPLTAKNPARAREVLAARHVAMYDAVYSCDIQGSSDASIANVVPTDLSRIVQESRIAYVFCNGATAYKYYMKYQGKQLDLPVTKLPSTSPANAAWSLDRLTAAWRVILDALSES